MRLILFSLLLPLISIKAHQILTLEEILERYKNEAEDSMEKDKLLSSGSPPSHTYVKFNELTEMIGEFSLLNLMTYESAMKEGLDSATVLNVLRLQRPDFCKAAPQPCNDIDRRYRRVDGTCNNLKNPSWGASYTQMARLLPPEYEDGYNIQRGGDGVKFPAYLPNARLVSRTVHPDLIKPDAKITNMLPQFGQFVDHDISLVPEGDKRCCHGVEYEDCWPITIYANDSFYSNLLEPQNCMDFTRSTPFCFPTVSNVRDQMSILTSYVDASNVYGSEADRHYLLRSHERGKLRVNSVNSKFPPTNAEIEALFGRNPMVMGTFLAGDDRVNEMPGLLVMHTLWLGEHNRIADGIYALMPDWDDEQIFQETRRILVAEWQNVVYGEYLPTLLGTNTMKEYGLTLEDYSSEYDENVDPTVFHAFADAAYRFGHTFINGMIQLFSGNLNIGSYQIRNNFFVPNQVIQDGGQGYNYILDGLLRQNAQTYDPFVTEDLSNFVLKLPTEEFGADLIARNFQRGRDHGLPPYMKFRQVCGRSVSRDWNEKPAEIPDADWAKLRSLYSKVEDIDLFTGGLIEVPQSGALTGPTFNCLKAMQFKRLKEGDRFFFTHRYQYGGEFDETQISYIRRRTLGDIICENSDVAQTQRNVFLTQDGTNVWLPCNSPERIKLDLQLLINTSPMLTTAATTPQPLFSCVGKPDGYYQHPSTCTMFLGCVNGNLRELSCPNSLVFHPSRETCVHINEYNCPF